jgi:hypothetical protein
VTTLRESLELVAADAESDARSLDGLRLTGLVVGTNLGQLYAQVYALAKVGQALLDRVEALEGEKS